ncbi:MAG: hypothetical protein AABX93_03045 [Nanoarchaeota archaeon]
MRKKRTNYKISWTYDQEHNELIIDNIRDRKRRSYCEPLEFNGMEIDYIEVIRDIDGRIAKIRIKDYSDHVKNPTLSEISERLGGEFPLFFLPSIFKRKS